SRLSRPIALPARLSSFQSWSSGNNAAFKLKRPGHFTISGGLLRFTIASTILAALLGSPFPFLIGGAFAKTSVGISMRPMLRAANRVHQFTKVYVGFMRVSSYCTRQTAKDNQPNGRNA